MSTEEQHATALLALLNAAPSASAADLDDIKSAGEPPARYTELTVSQRFVAPNRNPGSTERRGWRVTTRFVAQTVTDARELRRRASAHLRFARMTVDGETTTPIQLESEDVIGLDDGWYSGLSTWTYAT